MEVRWVISEGEGRTRRRLSCGGGAPSAPPRATPRPAPAGLGAPLRRQRPPRLRRGDSTRSTHRRGHVGGPRRGHHPPLATGGIREDVDDSFDRDANDEADPDVVHVAEPIADAAGNVSVHEMMRAQREVDARRNGGRSLEEHGLEAFSTMPMDRQQKIAAAFAGLKDGLMHARGAAGAKRTGLRHHEGGHRGDHGAHAGIGDTKSDAARASALGTKPPLNRARRWTSFGDVWADFSLTQHVKYSPTEYA